MKKLLFMAVVVAAFTSTAMAAGVWDGQYQARITGQDHSFKQGVPSRNINTTTSIEIRQVDSNVTVTLGAFAGVSSATAMQGKVGNGKITANWWHSGSPHQMKVLWGSRRRDGTIIGKILIPRSDGRLVPGWTEVTFTARKAPSTGNASAVHASAVHTTAHQAPANSLVAHVNPGSIQNKGIDPAAMHIKFDIVRRDTPFRGRVRVTGVVKNVGTEQYIDPRGRSGAVNLYRAKPFTTSNLVKSVPLKNLRPGQTQTVIHERDWNSSSSSEGEFPPTYWLDISYDPDIRADSCPTNDDCNWGNNRRSASGMQINTLFRNTTGTTVAPLQTIPMHKTRRSRIR